jgi:WD40 repeat protein
VNPVDFIELVTRRNVRPERPDVEDAPHLSDAIWKLAETCWVKDPTKRPTASAVSHTLSQLHDNVSVAQVKPKPKPQSKSKPSPTIPRSSPPLSLVPQMNVAMRGHTAEVWCAAFSVDGKFVVSGSADHTIRVWDAQSGNLVLGPLEMHTDAVGCVAFSPSGRRIASGSWDNTVRIWDTLTGRVVAGPLKGHTDDISSVNFSPDSEQFASCSYDGTVRVWNTETGNSVLGPLTGHTEAIRDVKFSGDGTRIVSCSDDGTIRVWDAKSSRLIQGPLRGQGVIFLVVFSLDEKRIISVSQNAAAGAAGAVNAVSVWDTETGALLCEPTRYNASLAVPKVFTPSSNTAAVSPNGQWMAGCVDNSCAVELWDLRTGQKVATFDVHADQVTSVAFSPDSKRILTASFDKTIRIHTLNL